MAGAIALVAIVAGFWLFGQRGSNPPPAAPDLTAVVVGEATSVPPSVFAAVGNGGLKDR